MTQKQSHRRSHINPHHSTSDSSTNRQRGKAETPRKRSQQSWAEASPSHQTGSTHPDLTNLIKCDAPLQSHSGLVLMYGPFQAEMVPQAGQGVASWLRECVRKHGLPSLVRFDYRHRAQVFRRDQFQPWLEPLVSKASS